jgi:hypothetical protein
VRHSRRACALLHQSPQLLSSHLLNVFHGAQLRLDAAFALAGSFVSTDGRIGVSAEGKLAAEAADNGLLAPELAAGIPRVKSAKTQGIRNRQLAIAAAGASTPERPGYLDAPGTA